MRIMARSNDKGYPSRFVGRKMVEERCRLETEGYGTATGAG